jgi:hypothetical protein
MEIRESVSMLVDEYRALLASRGTDTVESPEAILVREGDWTPQAAEHLMVLAKNYGSFMLRNALAISLVLEIEDGDFGF